jgi:Type III secretion system lipoprotein chaperone (YscW)
MANGRCICGYLVLPGPSPAETARASVSLIDATSADAAGKVLTETVFILPAPHTGPVPFRLSLPLQRSSARRWLYDASVTADLSGRLAAGDYVLGHTVECLDGHEDQPVQLNLERVT